MIWVKKLILSLIRKLGYEIVRVKEPASNDRGELQKEKFDCGFLDKIHYGCRPNYLEGWLNVDLQTLDHPGYCCANADLTQRHPFPSDQFAFGFAEDFIEHLGQAEQIMFLYEVYRTLKKGGILRLSFPGLEGVLKKHYPDPKYETAALAKYDAYEKWGHVHFPSLEELELICAKIGFCEVNPVEFGHSAYNELIGLDTRNDQVGLNTYVEIVK